MLRRLIPSAIKRFFRSTLAGTPFFRVFIETQGTQTPVTFRIWFLQKVLGFNRNAYWPVHFASVVTGWRNIHAGVDTSPGYMPGCYIQGTGKIHIGDYTQIGPNVGIISANHDVYDTRKHICRSVRIGKYCWIGMGSVILPGVELGDFTIVGAGSIVTNSFPEGLCFIRGNPATIVKRLDKYREYFVIYQNEHEYHGYIRKDRFAAFRAKHLNI